MYLRILPATAALIVVSLTLLLAVLP